MKIYFGTILIEPHRWKGLPPAAEASPWIERALAAGFDGIELWDRHLFDTAPAERERILALAERVCVFNSYARFDAGSASGRRAALEGIGELRAGVRGVKINLGRRGADAEAERAEAGRFLAALPDGVGLWCECHDGTVLESPEAAQPAFRAWGHRAAAIVHPVGMPRDRMRAWFEAAGGRVVHLHLQARDDDNRFTALRNRGPAGVAAFEDLRALGFDGSATLEFTTGVGGGAEDPSRTFDEAAADLAFLRDEVGL